MTEQKLLTVQEHPKKHLHRVLIACGVFLLLGLLFLAYWWMWGRFFEGTTDAYVSGNKIVLNSQVSGNVNGIYADDTEYVLEGQLLITLDETDAELNLELMKDNLGKTLRDVVSLFAQVKEKEAQVIIKEAALILAQIDFQRRLNLVEEGGVSLEDTQEHENRLIAAQEELNVFLYQYEALKAEVQNTTIMTHPRVQSAKDQLKEAWLALKRCKIKSPASGLVAQRNTQTGMHIGPNDPLLAIIPFDQMWVEANFKEVQLKKMRIAQNVRMKADMYGSDVVYEGKVIGIGGGTGSVFSILPPQNATGNWIKIVQRIPVRIGISQEQLKTFPLRLGLSMDVSVDLRSSVGPIIPPAIEQAILYKTNVFEDQEEGVDALIETIISQNLDPSLINLENTDE